MPAQRIEWIDECKGFVLLLVCLFHVDQSFVNIDMGMENMSAMRMSAFFFISGILFSTRRFPNFRDYIKHKAHVLLMPYILLSLLFLALDPVLYNFNEFFVRAPKMQILGTVPQIENVWDYIGWNLVKIFAIGKSSIGSGPLWFVFTLFCVSATFFAVNRIARANKVIILCVALAALTGGWALSRYHIHLVFGIERTVTILFFFSAGYLCKDAIAKLSQLKTAVLAVGTVICLALYAVIEVPNPNFSIMNNSLGKELPQFLGSSIFGIATLMFAFLTLSRTPKKAPIQIAKGILQNISRNGMIVLAVHWWVLLVLRITFKPAIDKPAIAYISIPIVVAVVIASIPLFRCKLYRLIAKEKVSVGESLRIRSGA